jgi:hypothetical protein
MAVSSMQNLLFYGKSPADSIILVNLAVGAWS